MKIGEQIYSIDIFLKRFSLAIEYDGAFWHRDKFKFDKKKNDILKNAGFNVIRLRQKPLDKISDMDIIVERKFNAKLITDAILLRIINIFALSNDEIISIDNYISKNSLQNQEAMNNYIEQRLKERSNNS